MRQHASARLITTGGGPCPAGLFSGVRCVDDGAGNLIVPLSSNWVYQDWPRAFPHYAENLNLSYQSDDTWLPLTALEFDYDVVFDDGMRQVLYLYQSVPRGRGIVTPAPAYWLHDPAVWDTWIPDNTQNAAYAAFITRSPRAADWQQLLDAYVAQLHEQYLKRQTSFLHDVIPLAAVFAAIVASGGGLSGAAAAPGADAATGTLPATIAAPGVDSTIPQYIAAITAPAPLPIDAALATDATSVGLAGSAGSLTTELGSWFESTAGKLGESLAGSGEKLIAGKVIQAIAPASPKPAAPAARAPAPVAAVASPPGLLDELFALVGDILNGFFQALGVT